MFLLVSVKFAAILGKIKFRKVNMAHMLSNDRCHSNSS